MLTEQTLAEYMPLVRKVVRERWRGGDWEDVAQQAALAAWERRRHYDPDKYRPGVWLAMVTRQSVAKQLYNLSAAKRDLPDGSVPLDALHEYAQPGVEAGIEWRERLRELCEHPDGAFLVEQELRPDFATNVERARWSKHGRAPETLRNKLREEYGP